MLSKYNSAEGLPNLTDRPKTKEQKRTFNEREETLLIGLFPPAVWLFVRWLVYMRGGLSHPFVCIQDLALSAAYGSDWGEVTRESKVKNNCDNYDVSMI